MSTNDSYWTCMSNNSKNVWRDLASNTTTSLYVVTALRCEDIEKVIFNDPATVMLFKDGTKVVVKKKADEEWNPVIGLTMCMAKYVCGNDESFHKIIKKCLPEY